MTKKPSVFEFLDAAQFLKAHFDWRKSRDPRFSLSAWAEEIGHANKVTLRFILKKQRNISPGTCGVLQNNLKMGEDERLCFEALVAYSQSKTKSQREIFGRELLKIQRRFLTQKELPPSAGASAFGPLILTLLTFTDFKMTAVNLAKLLMTEVRDVESILAGFVEQGLVLRNADGTHALTFPENKFRIPDNADLRVFYEYWIDRSKDALRLPMDVRKYRSLKFALSPAEYQEAVEKLNDYALGLLTAFQSDELRGRRLYMFESALFPVSAPADAVTDEGTERAEDIQRVTERS